MPPVPRTPSTHYRHSSSLQRAREARDPRKMAATCDTLQAAADLLEVLEDDVKDCTTEEFLEACADAGIPKMKQLKLKKLHVELIGGGLTNQYRWAVALRSQPEPVRIEAKPAPAAPTAAELAAAIAWQAASVLPGVLQRRVGSVPIT